ncbi:MAG: peptidoglycan DD-metalloendopeptidase family protein [Ignavibacteriota bacterium]
MPTIKKLLLLFCTAFAAISIYSNAWSQIHEDRMTTRFTLIAKRICEALNKGDFVALEDEFSPTLQKEMPLDKLKPWVVNLMETAGRITQMGAPVLKWKNVSITPIGFTNTILDLRLDLDTTSEKLIGFYFQPHVDEIPVPEKNSTHLSLPFKGEWAVMWGGDTKELNPHHDIKSQRFSIDFNVLRGFGKSHDSSGTKNEEYFAFSKEILSPADGKVTEVIDGVHDNDPFSPNQYSALGNCVIIRHLKNEYSVLSHLKMGSIQVKVGDSLDRGQVVGLCGNSGNSSEPHLEYYLINSPYIEYATGIKTYFDNVSFRHIDDAKTEKLHSPVREEKVKND